MNSPGVMSVRLTERALMKLKHLGSVKWIREIIDAHARDFPVPGLRRKKIPYGMRLDKDRKAILSRMGGSAWLEEEIRAAHMTIYPPRHKK